MNLFRTTDTFLCAIEEADMPRGEQFVIALAEEILNVPDDLQVTFDFHSRPSDAIAGLRERDRCAPMMIPRGFYHHAECVVTVFMFGDRILELWTLAHELGHVDFRVRFVSRTPSYKSGHFIEHSEKYADEVALFIMTALLFMIIFNIFLRRD